MEKMEFGAYLKMLRKANGLTLKELGNKVGLSHPYLSQIENGKRDIPSPDILKKFASVLGVSNYDLMAIAGYYQEDDLLEPIEETIKSSTEPVNMRLSRALGVSKPDLKKYLKQQNLFYDGVPLTIQDRELIKAYLETLFLNRKRED